MWGDRVATANTFTQVMDGPQDATLLILDTPPRDDQDSQTWVTAAQSLGDAAQATNKRGVIVATLPECITDAIRVAAKDANLVVLQGLHEALVALNAAAWLANNQAGDPPAQVVTALKTKLIDEADAKLMLQKNGVNVPNGVRCTRSDIADMTDMTDKISFPITLKGLGLAHKSEVGAVKVGLQNKQELDSALAMMPGEINEFLVEQTVVDVVAEILVSIRRDAPVGWLITLGAGGVYTELWRDTTFLLAPVDDVQILGSLAKLRIAPLLNGFRGKPAGNLNALVELIQNVISTAMNNNLVEVELNPVLVTPNTAVAVDALMIATQQ